MTAAITFSASHVWQLLALFGAAIAGGVVNSIAGGGSVITFPALLFVGVGPILASATNTVALWPASAAAAYGFRQDVRGAPRTLYWLIVPGLPVCWLCTFVIAWITGTGPTAQPIRQPVIA